MINKGYAKQPYLIDNHCLIDHTKQFYVFTIADTAIQFLLLNIRVPKLSSVSAVALETLCLTCYKQMARHFDVLAQVVKCFICFHLYYYYYY